MNEGGDSCLFLAGRGLLCSDSDEEGFDALDVFEVVVSFRADAGGFPISREGL